MGFWKNSKTEVEAIRGVSDESLSTMPDTQIIFLALARLFEGQGVDDEPLIEEMYRRGRKVV